MLSDTVFTGLLLAVIIVGFYVAKHRRLRGLAQYLGLHGAPPNALGAATAFALISVGLGLFDWSGVMEMLLADSYEAFRDSPNATGNQLAATGATGAALVVAAILKGGVQTALLEEIFFRGFIAKRLFNRLGFQVGNALQSLIFAALHMSFPFLMDIENPWLLAVFFGILSGVIAWIIGYMNERLGEGSILPGWIVHGVTNVATYVAAVV